MSRRHHGGRPHRSGGHARPAELPRGPSFAPPVSGGFGEPAAVHHEVVVERPVEMAPPAPSDAMSHGHEPHVPGHDSQPANGAPHGGPGAGWSNGSMPASGSDGDNGAACTAPQLRRFIKSRPYVPMHELRRRFGINGSEDDVTAVDIGSSRVFVGLPQREGQLLGELLRGGEIGYELSLDPRSPVVVGLYPMRPVARA